MYKKLEEFIEDNRNAFDADKPSEKVWLDIKSQFEEDKNQNLFFSRSFIIKAMSIAAITILVVLGIWYFFYTGTNKMVAKNNVSNSSSVKKDSQQIQQPDTDTHISSHSSKDNDDKLNRNEFTQELYYYTRLAEIKYNQLKKVEKEEPLIYKNFSGEIKKLDSTYQSLQILLTENPNKEEVLEAMINTLKIQVEILNRQLEIIHTINQAKKRKYENKTI